MLDAQPLEINQFTGGLTDDPTSDARHYMQADNLFLSVEQNWLSRPGSVCYDVAAAQLPTGNQRVSAFVNFNKDETLFAASGDRIFYYNAGAWTEVLNPAGGHGLLSNTATSRLTQSEWKRHVLLTSPDMTGPVKLINTGSWQAVTAGLPVPAAPINYVAATVLASAITLANALRTAIKSHVTDTFRHKASDATDNAAISSGASTDLATLITLTNQMIAAYNVHMLDAQAGGTYHYPYQGSSVTGAYACDLTDLYLDSTEPCTDLPTAVALLNDLNLRFKNHLGSMSIHNFVTDEFMPATNTILGVTAGANVQIDASYIYTLLEQIRTSYNAHLADGPGAATPHSTAADATNTALGGLATTPEGATGQIFEIRTKYELYSPGLTGHWQDAQLSGAWVYHTGKETTPHNLPFAPDDSADINLGLNGGNWAGTIAAMNELKNTLNAHMADLGAHYTTNPTAVSANGFAPVAHQINAQDLTLSTYDYALVYSHTYTINGVTFKTVSTPYYFSATDILTIGLRNATVQNIPVLDNLVGGLTKYQYDLANVKVEIYRTVENGSTYYFVDSVANGTTSYSDGVTDTELQTRATLYTTGGELPHDMPPANCPIVHMMGDTAFYANGNKIIQAIPGAPEAAYGSNYAELPQLVFGISSTRGIPVAWTNNSTYRLEGSFDSQGRGSSVATQISNTTGLACIGSGTTNFAVNGPVQVEGGIVFPGNDGFYFTDGYAVQKLNKKWRTSYLNLISTAAGVSLMQAVYDRTNRRVWWATNSTGGSENDSCSILDLNFPLSENCIFTSASGSTNFAPSAIGYFAGQIIRGDSRGYVFKHDDSYTNDPKVNTGAAASTWSTAWVTYTHKSPALDFGTSRVRKWISSMTVKLENRGTNVSLQINSNNDYGRVTSSLTPIRWRGGNQMLEEKRKFPAGSLRCSSKQITITNAKVVMYGSDALGLATLSHAAKTLTLAAGSWATDLADQKITFVTDNYVTEWTIASVAGAVMTITDPGGTLPADGTYKWEVKGYPKDEKIALVGYCLNIALLGQSQKSSVGESGANT